MRSSGRPACWQKYPKNHVNSAGFNAFPRATLNRFRNRALVIIGHESRINSRKWKHNDSIMAAQWTENGLKVGHLRFDFFPDNFAGSVVAVFDSSRNFLRHVPESVTRGYFLVRGRCGALESGHHIEARFLGSVGLFEGFGNEFVVAGTADSSGDGGNALR